MNGVRWEGGRCQATAERLACAIAPARRGGRRRHATRDDSRNNPWLALITFGEGWHNNHHFFPGSARQGFRWWEIDLTWYGLRAMQALGLVRDLKPVPAWVLAKVEN